MNSFVDKLRELTACCAESASALAALPAADEPEIKERVAERRAFASELNLLVARYSRGRQVGLASSLSRAWAAVRRSVRGPVGEAEDLERTLMQRYEGCCESSPPMSVFSVLLRQHDTLKRADFQRRTTKPSGVRRPSDPAIPIWPPLGEPSFGRSLGAPVR